MTVHKIIHPIEMEVAWRMPTVVFYQLGIGLRPILYLSTCSNGCPSVVNDNGGVKWNFLYRFISFLSKSALMIFKRHKRLAKEEHSRFFELVEKVFATFLEFRAIIGFFQTIFLCLFNQRVVTVTVSLWMIPHHLLPIFAWNTLSDFCLWDGTVQERRQSRVKNQTI